jgi:hypothetical protein
MSVKRSKVNKNIKAEEKIDQIENPALEYYPSSDESSDEDYQKNNYLDKLSNTNREFETVAKLVNPKKQKYEILSIYKVNNPNLLTLYNSKLDMLKGLNIEPNEKLLFHGTSGNNPKMVYTNGYRVEVSRSGLLGKGLYFARKLKYSLGYAYTRHGNAYLFLNKVITGRSKVITNVKNQNGLLGIGYEGVNGDFESITDVDNPEDNYRSQMFVVSKNCQVYPQYLIVIDLTYSFGVKGKKNNYLLGHKKNRTNIKEIDEDYEPI